MQPPWFYSPNIELGLIGLNEDESLHAVGSLRLEHGAPIVLFNGLGNVADATLEIDTRQIKRRKRGDEKAGFGELGVFARVSNLRPPIIPVSPRLIVVVGGCKGERLEWLVEKCAELGVHEIDIAIYERTIVKPGEKHVEKLRRVALEACKQCGCPFIPAIANGSSIEQMIKLAESSTIVVADPETPTLFSTWVSSRFSDATATRSPSDLSMYIFIGPEGGMTPAEIEQLRTAGGQLVRLTNNLLRVETAAIAAAAVWAAHVCRPVVG